MAEAINVFGTNQKFKEAVQLINNIPDDKLYLILSRIIKKLGIKNTRAFTDQEETQLSNVLGISINEVHSVLDAGSFIFEQSAYYTLNLQVMALQLEKAGISTTKIPSFEQAWKEDAAAFVGRLKGKGFSPLELDTIGWRLHLQMGQSSVNRLKEPSVIFNLGLKSNTEAQEPENLTLEFSREDLQDFFQKLEVIQEQLDNLG